MADVQEVEEAYKVITDIRKSRADIFVMHCTTQYPADLRDVNLNVLHDFKKRFDQKIGYSDHTMGIEVSLAAIALGSLVIEKHITLDRDDEGPDHKASILPEQFKEMVSLGNNIYSSLGSTVKAPTEVELKNKKIARRSIVAAKPIKKGDIFSSDNLDIKRPGTGLSPMKWYSVLGSASSRDYDVDDLIDESI